MAATSIHVNKLLAAKRQLQAAIRMYFQPEDEFAVHTVAAAAYGLLKDLKKSRGMSEAADNYLVMFFYAVRDFRRGTLPSHLSNDPLFMAEVERWAEKLPQITADSKLTDLRASISPELERRYWSDTNRAANFLKHADRDVEKAINLQAINNRLLLLKCVSAYQDLAPDDLGREGIVFSAFIRANDDSSQQKNSQLESLAALIRNVPAEHKYQFCYRVILSSLPPINKPSFLSALFGDYGPECGYRGESRSTKRLALCYHLVVTKLAAAISRQRFPECEVERMAHGFRVIYHVPYENVVVAERVSPAGSSGDSWQSGDCFSDAAAFVSKLCLLGEQPEGRDVSMRLARMDKAAARQAMAFVKSLRHRQFRVLRDGSDFSLVNRFLPKGDDIAIPSWLKPVSHVDTNEPLIDT